MAISQITNGMLGSAARAIINLVVDFANAKRGGFVDYNDATTTTTPIEPNADTWTNLTNDGAGPFTIKTYLPDGITDIWDVATDEFDFSELSLGDHITIRFDMTIITSSPNTNVGMRILLGDGDDAYDLQLGGDVLYKSADTHHDVMLQKIYMGADNTRLNPGIPQIIVDNGTTDIIVNGWAVFISRNGH